MDKMEMYRFFIPFKDNKNEEIGNGIRNSFVEELKLMCCETNGGYTIYEGNGGWLGESGIIEEPVTILETYGRNPVPKLYWQHYATFLKQECLLGVSGVAFNTVFTNSGVDLSIYQNTKVLKVEDGDVKSYRP